MSALSGWHARAFRSLRVVSFRWYLVGSMVSVIGSWMQFVAQDWLVLELSHSALALGVASALQFTPVLVLGLWGGVVVDRHDRRRLLMVTQTCSAVLAATLGVLSLAGLATLPMVYLLALGLGVVTVFDQPARQVFLADLVEEDEVINAQALYSTAYNLGRLLGPAMAGVLIAAAGVGPAFLLNAVSFLAVLLALARIDRSSMRPRAAVPRASRQVREAYRYVRGRPDLVTALLTVASVSILGQNFRVVLPLLAKQTLHGDAQTYGYLSAALGFGSVLGALGSAGRARPTLRALLVASAVFAVANLAAAVAPGIGWAEASMVGLGVANIALNTLARTLLLSNAAPEMRGRVMSLHALVFVGSTPVGGILLGWVCTVSGARGGLALAAVSGLISPVAVLAAGSIRRAGRSTREPAGSSEAAPSRDATPESRSPA